jgi:DNA (cytosine-5)-methyltransferase 1
MRSVELFTGAGGLAIGIENAGFRHAALVERDRWSCDTLRQNFRGYRYAESEKSVLETDVRTVDYRSLIDSEPELLAGGPPCQPFSLGGKHRGFMDERDMFPEVVRAVRELTPRAVIIENVKGLLRKSFASYVEYVLLQLRYPEIVRKPDEPREDHLSRLEQHHTHGHEEGDGLRYNVVFQRLNAADYGVPQRRERVFFVAFRDDQRIRWSFKKGLPVTHSQDALAWDQWVSGEYWDRHGIRRPRVPPRMAARVNRIATEGIRPPFEAWRTVRDAIDDLPDPRGAHDFSNHEFRGGARTYVGHTGSPYDEPSKTIKAGDHGVPGGENMLRHPNGRVRYFTVREAARIQCFPDHYVFSGAWSEAMRQIGNAVPVTLGEVVARAVREALEGSGEFGAA